MILLMEEILHRLGSIKPWKQWDINHINWCRISSITSIIVDPAIFREAFRRKNFAWVGVFRLARFGYDTWWGLMNGVMSPSICSSFFSFRFQCGSTIVWYRDVSLRNKSLLRPGKTCLVFPHGAFVWVEGLSNSFSKCLWSGSSYGILTPINRSSGPRSFLRITSSNTKNTKYQMFFSLVRTKAGQ